jgi:transposase
VFPRAVKKLLLQGLGYRNRFQNREMTAHGLKVMAGRLTQRLDNLVAPIKTHSVNERFVTFLEPDVGEIFTFLRHPDTDATNYRGEQAIRSAVVNRNVREGNRTENGAQAQSLLMSIIRTCSQRLVDPFLFLRRQLTSPTLLILPTPILAR